MPEGIMINAAINWPNSFWRPRRPILSSRMPRSTIQLPAKPKQVRNRMSLSLDSNNVGWNQSVANNPANSEIRTVGPPANGTMRACNFRWPSGWSTTPRRRAIMATIGAQITEHANADRNAITLGYIKNSPIGGRTGTRHPAV